MTTLTDNSDQTNLNTPGLGPDTIFAGAGGDLITTSTLGGSLIFGERDNDTLISVGPNDSLYGGPDEDSLVGQRERVFLSGDGGSDTVIAQSRNSTLLGGAGDDLLQGTVDGNLMFGNQGADTMLGGALGRDTLYGGKDNDSLGFFIAGGGNNLGLRIGGSAGGNQGSNYLRGDLGDDFIVGINQKDTLIGGKGNDTIYGVASNSYLSGDLDNDTLVILNSTQSSPFSSSVITIGIEKTTLLGGEGNDSLLGGIGDFGTGKNLLDGGAGNDTITVYATQDTALGGAGDDFIKSSTVSALSSVGASSSFPGFAGRNLLNGEDGNDTIVAAFASDSMIGGGGNDSLSGIFNQAFGGDGNDTIDATTFAIGTTTALITLDGGLGDDLLLGNTSTNLTTTGTVTNFMNGGEGSDTIVFGSRRDRLVGSFAGNDFISYATSVNFAGATSTNLITDTLGSNFIIGGNGTDVITTGAGDDILFGGPGSLPTGSTSDGDDTLNAGGGNDTLLGGFGNDYLLAGDGNDSLGGGPGADTLIGGAGNDSFYYNNFGEGVTINANGSLGSSPDQIGDFEVGRDKLVLNFDSFLLPPFDNSLPNRPSSRAFLQVETGTYNNDLTPAGATPGQAVLVYEGSTGRLLYDRDGAGGQAPIQLALLNGRPGLTATDITLI
ncbi:MAG: calcium-binding protein [Microcoleus sp. PH2017_01_SCD_O_A]|uniref:calcium-binding protein n=1 Tax=unclassified Microcoleus TaxID=2642155 RepID=UPI001D339A0C|nr:MULTISPECIES: calcium-binding protein [unclassified Microcoleus]MCC3425390.1 calcium-binding protein [Microcoleus sp. PH2017_01_SCD_O_A]MCC3591066.1 calcium-binding protein [Microcoleus sp. PH2017_28_MFU_U_A]